MLRRFLIPIMAFLLVLSQVNDAAAAVSGGWTHLGHGVTPRVPALNGAVYAVNHDDFAVLLVGGAFTNAGDHPAADYIAQWNGTDWSALGNAALNGNVRAIAYSDGKIYAGGNFTNAAGNALADYLAVWDGTSWSPFCTSQVVGKPAFNGSVLSLQVIGNTLYVGGSFSDGAGIASADFLVACDLTTGAASSTVVNADGMNGGIYALAAISGVLYAGGLMINVDHIAAADHVASYDGTWHAMGSGPAPLNGAVEDIVRALAVSGPNVYVGTDAVNVSGIAQADHVVHWNGTAWSAVGANTAGSDGWFPQSAFIYGLTTYANLVIATGSFQNANGSATADEIAYYDGSKWRPLGSDGAGNGPLTQQGTAVTTFKASVVVGGSFVNAGADSLADYLAEFRMWRPDARIAASASGPFTGDNVYSATAAGESKSISITHGHKGTLYVDIQNDGVIAAAFDVKGAGGSNGFSVSYFNGAVNITSEVLAGDYSTGQLAPGAHKSIKIVIGAPSASGKQATFRVSATTAIGGTLADAVKAKASST